MAYEAEFKEAVDRTRSWGLTCQFNGPTNRRYASPNNIDKVSACAQEILGSMSPEDVAAQCFAVSSFLSEPLQEVLQVPLAYTLGYVNLGQGNVFHTPLDNLKAMLDAGYPSSRALELHAWLTLPSGEIIDPTLATTVGLVRNLPELLGRAAFTHPNDLIGNHSYHPQLVGEDYLRRIGVMIELEGIFLEEQSVTRNMSRPSRGGPIKRGWRSLFNR